MNVNDVMRRLKCTAWVVGTAAVGFVVGYVLDFIIMLFDPDLFAGREESGLIAMQVLILLPPTVGALLGGWLWRRAHGEIADRSWWTVSALGPGPMVALLLWVLVHR